MATKTRNPTTTPTTPTTTPTTPTTKGLNIVSDIAGHYKTLLALVEKMPSAPYLSVGDMIDRGPQSKEVVEWFMKNGNALLGNHEHFLLDAAFGERCYPWGSWEYNGGGATAKSFGMQDYASCEKIQEAVGQEVLSWLMGLPLEYRESGLIVSHAPRMCPGVSIPAEMDRFSAQAISLIWNRERPEKLDGHVQIFGHNSPWGLRYFDDTQNPWAICLDASSSNILTGIHWPTLEVFQQTYID